MRIRWGKARTKSGREQPHVSGETDQVDAMLLKAGDDLGIVLRALAAARFDHRGWETPAAGRCDARRIRSIGNDDGDLSLGKPFSAMASAMARKFEPRPESRIPNRAGWAARFTRR